MNENKNQLQVLPQIKLPAKVPKLKSGNDAEAAEKLSSLFDEAQNGMRKVVAFGLFAWELKLGQLKHGQFGAWLAVNCPKLATAHSKTGKPMASRALNGHMDLAKSVLETAGFATIGKFLSTAGKSATDANLGHGQFLLTADKNVPEKLKAVREKIFEIVDGKSQRQLFAEFKQAEEGEDDGERTGKKQHGRVKGSTGCTKEMRAKAEQRAEEQRLEELNEQTKDTAKFLLENSDAKNFGALESATLEKLEASLETALGFLRRLAQSRNASGAATE